MIYTLGVLYGWKKKLYSRTQPPCAYVKMVACFLWMQPVGSTLVAFWDLSFRCTGSMLLLMSQSFESECVPLNHSWCPSSYSNSQSFSEEPRSLFQSLKRMWGTPAESRAFTVCGQCPSCGTCGVICFMVIRMQGCAFTCRPSVKYFCTCGWSSLCISAH